MADAFVNTIKPDYVYSNDCYDAKTVLKLLPGCVEDYNSVATNSGNGIENPVEYKKLTK